ncbi:MAG: hypothetical protein ACK55K_07680 [Bacteroidota bacterium]|jgi:hypothetical protein
MRYYILLVVIILFHNCIYAQLYDGTIDGAMPGKLKDVVAHFEKKGYRKLRCPECSTSILFMEGQINKRENLQDTVTIYMVKDNLDSTNIKSVSLYYQNEYDTLINQFKTHKKIFFNSFGRPSQEEKTQSRWIFLNYTYTIGYEGYNLYHKVEVNKSFRDEERE